MLVVMGMAPGRRAQKPDLPAITAAPFAEEKVTTQTESFEWRQPAIERG